MRRDDRIALRRFENRRGRVLDVRGASAVVVWDGDSRDYLIPVGYLVAVEEPTDVEEKERPWSQLMLV